MVAPTISIGLIVTETGAQPTAPATLWSNFISLVAQINPGYTVLHQNANFTGKRRQVKWSSGQSFIMDFGPGRYSVAS